MRALALTVLVVAAATVAFLGVATVGARPPAEHDAASGAADAAERASPVYPGLRTVADISQPGGRPRATVVGPYPGLREPGALVFPGPEALEDAAFYAAGREGRVSFAVADTRGEVIGLHPDRRYRAASLAKAMVLVAYLGEAERKQKALTPAQRKRLEAMILASDNLAATKLHREIGLAPMLALARRAGMRHFTDTGMWSETSATAGDQARFFAALDRLLPRRERAYARRLLENVVELQSWGVPRAARPAWRVMFKGAWRPATDGNLVHQAARLERGPHSVAVAVLTDANPGQPYGEETIRQLAARLLAAHPTAPAVPVGSVAPAELRPVTELRGASRAARIPVAPAGLRPVPELRGARAPSPRPLLGSAIAAGGK